MRVLGGRPIGRTPDSGSGYPGSSPGLPANLFYGLAKALPLDHATPIISLSGEAMKKARLAVFIVFSLLVLSLLSPARIVRAQGKSSLPIMPLPAHVVEGEGEFPIDGNFGIALKGYKEPR